ncbi:MAG: ABC-F family ATP-binding cassette domain-containing protein [Bacilli bacterium]
MLSVNNLGLRFPEKVLFEEVNLQFNKGSCYGVIGANGAGKTTFLKILSGEIDSTSGEVTLEKGSRMSVLKQNHYEYDEKKVLDVVIMGNKRLYEVMTEKDSLYSKGEFTDEDGIKISKLEDEFLALDGWSAEYKAGALLTEIGVDTSFHEKQMKELESKDKVKVLLASCLFDEPDVLIMDEPTNNLDIKTIKWLQEFIIEYKNTVIVVSHDRSFLNSVCTHILDIDYSKIKLFVGNYDFWYESSELIQRQLKNSNKKKEERIKELQDFIARFSANASKSKQATSRKRLLEKIELDDMTPSSRKHPYINFAYDTRLGEEVVKLVNVSKTINGVKILDNVNLNIYNDNKVYIYGNSVTTSLLLEIISGDLMPDSGEIFYGNTVIKSYFKQDDTVVFNRNITIFDYIKEDFPSLDDKDVRSFLGRMLFSADDAFKKINILSGGERVRCKLSKMMINRSNFLIMDEPTNHLDLESITSLNKALMNFAGSIIFTSEDYEFINSTTNRVIELTEDGKLKDRGDSYEDFIIKKL